MANVVFVWHMHQPYYVNSASKLAMMPWVRLHAVKGYLDMVSVLAEFPRIHVNVNLTPVLMLQIEELVTGKVRDLWFEWSRKPAADLEEHEQLAILEHFFKIHHENLLLPFPRYAELLAKRGAGFYREKARADLRHWTAEDLRDLQTWYNLAWCGFTAEKLFPELGVLKRKGRHFTEEEKLRVLDIHMDILGRIAPLYAEAEARGQVELTTTPFFHPILPLVYDTDIAERCMPGRARPKRFHWPQDALAQLQLAVEQHTRMFGRPPRGLWPSEGSVAPELIPLMQKVGLKYFCTDEENLFNSLRRAGEHADHLELFQGWRVEHQGAAINAIFREKPLSDFIGFMAWRNEPHQAASHLLTHFRHICDQLDRDNELVPIILDGENCWENFRDGGETFLRELYAGLSDDPRLTSCTVEDYFRRNPPKRTVTTLHSGSWIRSDFDIWIGDEEENRAWELLGQTREFLEEQKPSGALGEAALREIYAAEGSDWFWWYGPDFTTECDVLFDDLFRQHLKNVYTLCGHVPPPELDRPIIGGAPIALYRKPRRLLTPTLEGGDVPYFEWIGAGHYVAGSEQGAMFRDDRFLRDLHFGTDTERLLLRASVRSWESFRVVLVVHQPGPHILQSAPLSRGQSSQFHFRASNGAEKTVGLIAAGTVIEAAIPFAALGAQPGGALQFQVKIFHKDIERECYPENAPFELVVPGSDALLENWVV
jgi:alpha-amylase/alpha-mannosidase (GH57 family)